MSQPLLSGIDVSQFQGVINWSAVKSSGKVQLVYARATDGANIVDSQFSANWTGIRSVGLPRGAYHVAMPSGTTPSLIAANAQHQAAVFLNVVNQSGGIVGGDLPPALDVESTGGLSDGDLVLWIQHWLSDLNAAVTNPSQTAILYASLNFFQTHLSALHGTVRLWIADYSAMPNIGQIGHQYTDALIIPGISVNVDGDTWLPSILPNAATVPVIQWSANTTGVSWSFTEPDNPAYLGWNQSLDVPNTTSPAFGPSDTIGHYEFSWMPPGTHHVVLTFFFAGQTPVSATSPPYTVLSPLDKLTAQVDALQTELGTVSQQSNADHVAIQDLQKTVSGLVSALKTLEDQLIKAVQSAEGGLP